ncbi:MAG TPA: hypothetical protein VN418_04250 [Gammaproteobacteria bacterium]|nr:hypothetical protein [Gammaproteobacteria bacterium]
MKITKMKSLILAFVTVVAVVPMAANADPRDGSSHDGGRHDGGRHDGARNDGGRHDGARHNVGRHWDGNIREFHNRDLPRWRAGYWHHGAHEDRLGWWWVIGGLRYFYPQPVYPYPNPYTPPIVVIPQTPPAGYSAPAPQAQNWYYCASAKNYYPYVPSCPEGWRTVPASPPDVPAP